jgi:Rab-GTPase-TBC domain
MEEKKVQTEPLGTPVMTPEAEEPASTPTPRKHVDSKPIPTDSLVTISLSESNRASGSTGNRRSTIFDASESVFDQELNQSRTASLAVIQGVGQDENKEAPSSRASSIAPPVHSSNHTSSDGSEGSLQVDWDQLDKAEEREDADAESDEVCLHKAQPLIGGNLQTQQTTLLLARLEQENAALMNDSKSGLKGRNRAQSRPPSVYQLKKLVQEQGARSVRFSLLPAAAPMTELDFWAALVQDYPQTAQRLPTVTSNKIRQGIPAPLRGVVWASMAGARDPSLEEQYDKLCNESSPYETIINKDIGRSFPGVAMFREADGDGQRMLASVLKCYSLYDKEIGYCQGLGFLVGPLLMNMGDKQAFCVLVRYVQSHYR